jgi:pyridinium-3,5-biscarboxylic acid mononucleotide synthase
MKLKSKNYLELGIAKYDLKREKTKGFPEVILGLGKNEKHLTKIITKVLPRVKKLLITKVTGLQYNVVNEALSGSIYSKRIIYNDLAKIIYIGELPENKSGKIVVVCGGTSDLPVAEEASVTLEIFGSKVERLYDVGVAGLHRLLSNLNIFKNANVVIVVAGMEGALPSVVAGQVSCPVIAVPTSIGYGSNFEGLSALLTMLNSCAVGMSVVNIDNGFGAAYQAHLINKMISNK